MNEFLVVGNPNSGKTTLFNELTKSNEHTGNWHGVTIDEKKAKIINSDYLLIDLPGTYSLSSFSFEEQITIDKVLTSNSSIINLCDINTLKRNLYLTLQLIEAEKDFRVVLNLMKSSSDLIDYKMLSSLLNRAVLIYDADKCSIEDDLLNSVNFSNTTQHLESIPYISNFLKLKDVLIENAKNINISPIFCAIKYAENDEKIISKLNLSTEQVRQANEICLENNLSIDTISQMRFNYIDELLEKCSYKNKKITGYSKLDKLLLNKYFALPMFMLIVCLIYVITFKSLGAFLSNYLNHFFNSFVIDTSTKFLANVHASKLLTDFICNGLLNGITAVLSFLPQVTLLYFCIAILEESGYLSRIAFLFEDIFRFIGLSGKSIFTFILSFGCSTTAMLTSRNLEDENSRVKTVMLSPYMTCSAKVPLFTILTAAFFLGQPILIFALYLLGIIVALIVSFFLNKGKLKSNKNNFILELPNYRIATAKSLINSTLNNSLAFVSKVGSVLLLSLIVIWFLQNFDFAFRYTNSNADTNSILQCFSKVLAPLFVPLGFGNWGAATALLTGVVAKEVIVSTIAMLNGIIPTESGNNYIISSLFLSTSCVSFNAASAISFMVFALLYTPCISSISVMKSEIGLKRTLKSIVIQFVIAYILSFITYKLFSLDKIWLIVLSIIAVITIVFIAYCSYVKHSKCAHCNKKCSINCCK